IRDETCRFPGCRRQATGCDVDHTIPWATGGTTAITNLAHLCRRHHRIKHETPTLGAWQGRHINPNTGGPFTASVENTTGVGSSTGIGAGASTDNDIGTGSEQAPAGVLEWTSPTGTVRRTVPGTATPITTTWLTGQPAGQETTNSGTTEPADHPQGPTPTADQATDLSADDPPPF
ncbi:HNH endonuclease, partial [Kocuria coralli]